MRSKLAMHIIGCHAEGEVGDVIVGGVAPPPGASVWEQSRFIATDGALRSFVLQEPRGGVFRHINLLVPAKNPDAQMGFIIMEPEDTPPMSGSNCICVATVLLDTGIIPMQEPITELILEAPAGLIHVRATCANGKAERITLRNVPAFVEERDATLDVPGLGTIRVDTAFGGDSFVIVKADDLGLTVTPEHARDLAVIGRRIADAANEQRRFVHPNLPEWTHYSFCYITGPLEHVDGMLSSRNACAVKPGKIDRSPTGTGCSAQMALLHAQGKLQEGESFLARSIIESRFIGRVAETTRLGDRDAIVPEISGRAWITEDKTLLLDPDDPWPTGYRISDTWPSGSRPGR